MKTKKVKQISVTHSMHQRLKMLSVKSVVPLQTLVDMVLEKGLEAVDNAKKNADKP